MATVVTLRPDGIVYTGGEKPTWELSYNIEGTDNCIQAKLALLYNTPGIYDGLVRDTPRIEYQGKNFFTGSVTYGKRDNDPNDPDEEGSIEFSCEFGGATERMYQSLSTTKYPSTATDYHGAMGIVKNGDQIDVQGIDIDSPHYSFSLKCHFPKSYFTPDRRYKIYLCTVAPVNSKPFYGFEPGEVLFKGGPGGLKLGDDYGDIEFRFDCSQNMTGLTVGGIGGIDKQGWQYAEVIREIIEQEGSGNPVEGEGGGAPPPLATKDLIPKPVSVRIHTVFHTSDFSALLGV